MKKMNKLYPLLFLLFSYLFIDQIVYNGFITSIGLLGIIITSYSYLRKNNKVSKHTTFYFITSVLLALSFSVFENRSLLLKQTLVFFSMAYWLIQCTATKESLQDRLLINYFWQQIILLPFKHFATLWKQLLPTVKNSNRKHAILGILLASPLLLLVIASLMDVDQTFNQIFESIFLLRFLENIDIIIVCISFVFASLLFAALVLNSDGVSYAEKKGSKRFSIQTMRSFITSFICIYSIFILSVLYTMLSKTAVTAFELSNTARQAFFQLSFVSLINLCIVFIARNKFYSDYKQLQNKLIVLTIQTIFMTILAFVRMCNYISSYGITILRFNTSLLMIFELVACVMYILSLLHETQVLQGFVKFVLVVMVILNYCNIDGLIIGFNKRYGFENTDYNQHVSILSKRYTLAEDGKTRFYYDSNINQLEFWQYNLETLYYLNH